MYDCVTQVKNMSASKKNSLKSSSVTDAKFHNYKQVEDEMHR